MKKTLTDPVFWFTILMVWIVLTAVDVPIWRECRSFGFSKYYCLMHLK